MRKNHFIRIGSIRQIFWLAHQEGKLLWRCGATNVLAKLVPIAQVVFHVEQDQMIKVGAPPKPCFVDINGAVHIHAHFSHGVGAQVTAGGRCVHQQDTFFPGSGVRSRHQRSYCRGRHFDTVFAFAPDADAEASTKFLYNSFCCSRRAILFFLLRWNLALSPLIPDIFKLLKNSVGRSERRFLLPRTSSTDAYLSLNLYYALFPESPNGLPLS